MSIDSDQIAPELSSQDIQNNELAQARLQCDVCYLLPTAGQVFSGCGAIIGGVRKPEAGTGASTMLE